MAHIAIKSDILAIHKMLQISARDFPGFIIKTVFEPLMDLENYENNNKSIFKIIQNRLVNNVK